MIITGDGNIPSIYAHSMNVMKMAQGFFDAGEDVTVVTLLTWLTICRRFQLGSIRKCYGISNRVKMQWVPVWNRDFFIKGVNAYGYHEKAARLIARQKPNFVYCRSHLAAYYCVQKGIPTILESHIVTYDNADLQKVYKIADHPSFLGLITIHDLIKAEHVKRGIPEAKVLVLPDAVDVKQFLVRDDKTFWRKEMNLPNDKKIILYCGSLYKEKGIETILRSASHLSHRCDIMFVLVGGSKDDIKLWQKMVEELSITNMIFVSRVPNSQVPGYLKCADILIMPYSKKVSYQQMDIQTTSPLKLYEYMASNRPIISTDIPVIAKVIPHNQGALLAGSDNVDQIVQHILCLLEDEKLASRLTSFSLKRAQECTWTNRCKVIMQTFVNR